MRVRVRGEEILDFLRRCEPEQVRGSAVVRTLSAGALPCRGGVSVARAVEPGGGRARPCGGRVGCAGGQSWSLEGELHTRSGTPPSGPAGFQRSGGLGELPDSLPCAPASLVHMGESQASRPHEAERWNHAEISRRACARQDLGVRPGLRWGRVGAQGEPTRVRVPLLGPAGPGGRDDTGHHHQPIRESHTDFRETPSLSVGFFYG